VLRDDVSGPGVAEAQDLVDPHADALRRAERALAHPRRLAVGQLVDDLVGDGGAPVVPARVLEQADEAPAPGLPDRGAMFARDMGPDANAQLIQRYPRRRVGVLYRRAEDGYVTLARYDEGMEALWGDSAVTEAQ